MSIRRAGLQMTLSELFTECGGNALGTDVTVDGFPVDRVELSGQTLNLESAFAADEALELLQRSAEVVLDLIQEVERQDQGLAWLRSLLQEHATRDLLDAIQVMTAQVEE